MKTPKLSFTHTLLALIVILFVGSASSLIDTRAPLFSWPDEMANWFFISSHTLKVAQPLDLIATNLITPRSITLASHFLVPVGFAGLPLIYGILSYVLGNFVLYLTPFITAGGVVALYIALRRTNFNSTVALVGSLLLATLPGYWYFAHFSLLPNVLVCALAIGVMVLVSYKKYFLSGLLLALITLIRPLEMSWIGFLLLLYALYYRKEIKWYQYVFILFPVLCAGIGVLVMNKYLYGSSFALGYFHTISQNSNEVVQALLPFAFNLKTLFHIVITYLIPTHWHYFALASFGVVSAYFAWSKKVFTYYMTALIGVFVILSVLYGTYAYPDTFITQISVLGISYNRYYLPFFILLIPLIAQFVTYLITTSRVTRTLGIILVLAVLGINVAQVYGNNSDSIPHIKQSIQEYQSIRDTVLHLTPSNAVIVTLRADKVVFPSRQVIAQYDPSILDGFEALQLEGIPLYYMGYKDERPANLTISNPQELGYGYTLYTITHE